MNKRFKSKNKQYNPTKDRSDDVNYDIEHYEPDPSDAKTFIERMMVLGYTFQTISDQLILKYKVTRNNADFMVKNIRKSWIAYGSLESDEKRAILEQQLNHVFRECLNKNELNVAAIILKRKMELSGVQTSSAGKGSVNCNINVGSQGLTPEDLLPKELIEERDNKLKEIELLRKQSKKSEDKDNE